MTPEWHRAATSNARVETGRRPFSTQILPNLRCQLMAGHIRASPIILAPMNRRTFLQATVASAASLAFSHNSRAADNPDLTAIQKEIEKRHDESVERLRQWIRQPSIAAEHRGMDEGCDLTMRMLRDAGFGEVTKISTDGQPGIFATLDAGAPRTIGLYFMYDVKQVDPAEWSSPPFEAAGG
jgi:hypothetical protein